VTVQNKIDKKVGARTLLSALQQRRRYRTDETKQLAEILRHLANAETRSLVECVFLNAEVGTMNAE
jgi:uncharacterized Fe-S cluster-containing MiaB family protein